MSAGVTQTWYRIALARPDGTLGLVAASGEHLGIAINAAEHHIRGSYAIAGEVATGDQIPLGESVGKERVVDLGDVPPAQAEVFHWPTGVLPQLGHPVAGRRGYFVHPDPKLLVIEAQTDADHLTDLFLGMIERLPAADNLEIRLLDHFEDTGKTDVWLTSRVDAKKIIRFLDDHDELLANGHLEISVYVRKHSATLRLTEHKTVVWLADAGPNTLEIEVAGWLKALAVPHIDAAVEPAVDPAGPVVRISSAPHYHYRPAKSRDRAKLVEMLYRQRLRRVDRLEAAAGPREAD